MRTRTKLLFLLISFVSPLFLSAQKIEGVPFIRNYTPTEYKASTDNWAIAQDKRGIMYFGNATGVLEYDGVAWRIIEVSNNSLVRSIAIDSNGTVYIGAVGEFGLLEPEKDGSMVYRSLVGLLPESEREFADVWKTYATPEGIYFQTFSKIIRIKNGVVKIWKPQTSYHFSYYQEGKFYVIEREQGLKCMHDENLQLIKGGAFFAGLRIYSLLPYANGTLLAATREKGLVLIDPRSDSTVMLLSSELNNPLINDQVYCGVKLRSDRYAFGTLKKGVVVMDHKGKLVQVLNKENGLRDDVIKNLGIDNQEDLWLALGNGISHAEISAPINTLSEAQGISGFIWDITRYRNKIFVASSVGVYESVGNRFELLKGISSETWSIKPVALEKDTMLLAASESGIYAIRGSTCTLLQEGFGYFIYQSRVTPTRVYVGMSDGLLSLKYDHGKWVNEDYLSGIDDEIRSVAEDRKGDLWLGTPFDGLLRLHFEKLNKKDTLLTSWGNSYKIARFDTLSGLPALKYNIPYTFNDHLVIATIKGLYEFDENNNRFFPSNMMSADLKENQIFRLAAIDSSYACLVTVAPNGNKETGIAIRRSGNSYEWYTKPFHRVFEREFHAILPDDKGVIWLGGPDGLLHYDPSIKKDFTQSFNALIRLVVSGKDSIFGGTYYDTTMRIKVASLMQPSSLKPRVSYTDNSLRFEYAAASYGGEESNHFSIYLEGFDSTWTKWSDQTSKEYTNLKEGEYIFHVKAKNIYGAESVEAAYYFKVLPPWYRTWWAYVAYVLVFIGSVYFVIRLSIRRLVKQKERLEGIVKERTAEIEHQKEIVEEKNKDIMDSINYAQRIQRALLASEKVLKAQVPDHFVFFQPKDVVSGDFYWGSVLANGQFALVTADSTGHGVPGAIMSILNISCLAEAVNAHKLVSPDEILNFTRSKIIQHLSNDGSAEGGKDGMDCSLTCFDIQKLEMSYAAANNPLWIVRNKQIIEYDPDKMPVGKHDRDSIPFAKTTITLQKGDVIYTSTDGMPDQFGGPKGKKFMYKKLKELFVSISDLSMNEQKHKLSEAINSWKGGLEQVDDVCVIGVRI